MPQNVGPESISMAIIATLAFIPFIGIALLNIAMTRPNSPRLSQVVETYMGRYPVIAAGLAGFVGALAGHVFWATGDNPSKPFADLRLLPIALGLGIALGGLGAGMLALVGSLIRPITCQTRTGILAGEHFDLEVDAERVVCVRAHCPWNDTALAVKTGQRYSFVATGEWWDWVFRSDPRGYEPPPWSVFQTLLQCVRRVPTAQWFALSAQLLSEHHDTEPIAVESELSVASDGRLILFANDVRGFYWNNWGSICVTIRRIR